MKVIAVANQKGGVGKTTVTRELSACCALRGYQTLVIDSDPQANLTGSWVEPDIYNITLSHVPIEPEAQAGAKLEPRLDDAIVESPLTNLDLVSADIRLARFEMQPDYLAHRLTKQIGEHASGYDLVFIDCPPQLGSCLLPLSRRSRYPHRVFSQSAAQRSDISNCPDCKGQGFKVMEKDGREGAVKCRHDRLEQRSPRVIKGAWGRMVRSLPATASNYLPYFILCSHYFHEAERPHVAHGKSPERMERKKSLEAGRNGIGHRLYYAWEEVPARTRSRSQ